MSSSGFRISRIVMKKLLLLSVFLFSAPLHAADWEELDSALSQPLCVAFQNGTTYRFDRRNCTSLGCEQYSYYVRTFCGETASGGLRATIQQFRTPGGPISQESISEQDWNALRGNLLRFRARYVESFGSRWELVSVVAEGESLKASYRVVSRMGTVVEQGYWIFGRGPAAIPQILERFVRKEGLFDETDLQVFVP